ncbi:MAG: RNA 2',3'-cyclic phosphodiesterase [Acidimicrobiia bacterium]|nr:RNA 2',3'-cyclic phosphodiesterase [Acidimicrobiia bacterium]NNL68871.1 RNA 2',3'-cyclic phosphodiesterase [Acidimicrobiia bacterium]
MEPHDTRRVFVAVDLTDDVRHGLAAHLDAALDGDRLPGSTPPPVNWHLTLRFLGKIGQGAYEGLLAQLDQADLGGPFDLQFGGLGAFPRPARATVLWLGTAGGTDELADLAIAVEEAAVRSGAMPEERPFHPHVTLGRIRPPRDVRPLIERVPPFPLSQRVEAITVFESHLGGAPAVYEILERFRLG